MLHDIHDIALKIVLVLLLVYLVVHIIVFQGKL